MKILNGENVCGVKAPDYNYIFRKSDGFAMRWGTTQDEDPFWGPMPELADISISNRCSHGCHFCYRDSQPDGPLMSLDDYRLLMEQLPGTFQLALGGGEPTEHPEFIEFLRLSYEYGKVPNYTTNGTLLTNEIIEATKKYCGAVAVSWSDKAVKAIDRFVKGGVKTNIHFILSPHTIKEGIKLMKNPQDFGVADINAVVFLLHKAIGRGQCAHTPTFEQTRPLIIEAFSTEMSVAFDVCSIPHVVAAEQEGAIKIDWNLLDFCDGSRFTVYVDEDLNVSPCSFMKGNRFAENLREKPMNEIWHGKKFEEFRCILRADPQSCPAIGIDKANV